MLAGTRDAFSEMMGVDQAVGYLWKGIFVVVGLGPMRVAFYSNVRQICFDYNQCINDATSAG